MQEARAHESLLGNNQNVDAFVDGQERGSKQINYFKRGTNKGQLWKHGNTGQFFFLQ